MIERQRLRIGGEPRPARIRIFLVLLANLLRHVVLDRRQMFDRRANGIFAAGIDDLLRDQRAQRCQTLLPGQTVRALERVQRQIACQHRQPHRRDRLVLLKRGRD